MRRLKIALLFWALCAWLTGFPVSAFADTSASETASDLVTLLDEQNRKLSDDLRRIQREIAALRAELDKPRLHDIISGVGYIFGLFGVAAFVAARRKE